MTRAVIIALSAAGAAGLYHLVNPHPHIITPLSVALVVSLGVAVRLSIRAQ
ncbi:MAG: hypothetical protein ACDS79_13955 [Enterobacteriaceae bacterium]